MKPLQRLGKNIGGYRGEIIDIEKVARELARHASNAGFREEYFLNSPACALRAYHRETNGSGKRLYLSAGIHGDEPAGPLAVLELLKANAWPADWDIRLCPCLNPTGFALNRRENERGVDLNRQYLHLQAEETRAHVAWLNQQPEFDLTLCLHEDWEAHGFYLYELNPDSQTSFADAMIRNVSEVCPIDVSPAIEGREARGGIIRPSADPRSRREWPEAFYLLTHKTRLCYTLEAPSDFPLNVRVAALMAAVQTTFDSQS